MTDSKTITNGSSARTRREADSARFGRLRPDAHTVHADPSPGERTAILLADGRTHYLNVLEAILAPLRQSIIRVRTGEEAQRHLVQSDVAILLLDVALPGLEGIATTELPRTSEEEESEGTPIVVVTDLEQPEMPRRGRRGGRAADELEAEAFATALRSKVASLVALHEERAQVRRQRETARREEQEERDRAQNEFLTMVAHELRGPLSALLGWTHILRTAVLPEGEVERALETIERNARNQSELIEDLIDFTRMQAGQFTLNSRSIDLTAVVHAAVESLRPAADAKGVALEATIPSELPAIEGDPERLQQVVRNLLANSVKFTPAGGRVDVCVSNGAGTIELTVRDTGAGIPAESLARIFERRLGFSDRSRQSGLGLGLAIVRQIVELHGGTVHAASEGAEHGATFTVVLPCSAGGSTHEVRAVLHRRATP